MYLKSEYITNNYIRKSKNGICHSYFRKSCIVTFKCDECNAIFTRKRGDMDPNRLNNNVYHVCNKCDAKRFAQKKGIENKKVWDLPASSMKTLDQL